MLCTAGVEPRFEYEPAEEVLNMRPGERIVAVDVNVDLYKEFPMEMSFLLYDFVWTMLKRRTYKSEKSTLHIYDAY